MLPIIPALFSISRCTYYAQNYAGIMYQSLIQHHIQTHSKIDAGVECTLAYHETCFSEVNELEALGKVICSVYAYFEKQFRNVAITISLLLSHNDKGNMTSLNYDHTGYTLEETVDKR